MTHIAYIAGNRNLPRKTTSLMSVASVCWLMPLAMFLLSLKSIRVTVL